VSVQRSFRPPVKQYTWSSLFGRPNSTSTHVRPNSRMTMSVLTGNARSSQIQSLFVRNTQVWRENTTRNNAVLVMRRTNRSRNLHMCETADVTVRLTGTPPAGASTSSVAGRASVGATKRTCTQKIQLKINGAYLEVGWEPQP